jgi:hypothetical protein
VAVIGSIAVLGGGASAVAATRGGGDSHVERTGAAAMTPPGRSGAKPLASLTKDEMTALAKARTAIAAASASIAEPILDRALAAGTITAAQKQAFVASLTATPGTGSGPDGTWTGATGATGAAGTAGTAGTAGNGTHVAPSAAVQAIFASVQKAIQAQVSSIATPVLDAAVTAATITSAQETTLLALLESGPIAHGGPGGPHGGMPGPGGPGGGGPAGAPAAG